MANFRVDPRFRKGKGFLHYAFKTKAQIDKEQRERMAAEWNEWDLESLVRYRFLKEWNARANKEETEAKKELRMKLRIYANTLFRGGVARPQEIAIMKELQQMPGRMLMSDYVKDGDLTTVDLALLLKYVELSSIPRPQLLLHGLFVSNHVLDDYSCGYFFHYCAKLLDQSRNVIKIDSHISLYSEVQTCFKQLREREHGHRATMHAFTYAQYIKCAAIMQDTDAVLSFKADFVEREPTLLNASVFEGVFQCLSEQGLSRECWLEYEEMYARYRLAPTDECLKHLLRMCCHDRDFAKGEELWALRDMLQLEANDIDVFNAKLKLAALCGEHDRAFYHYYEVLEHTNLTPTLETCNQLIAASDTPERLEEALVLLNKRVMECNSETYRGLFEASARFGDLTQLDRFWDMMQDRKERPSIDALHAYLRTLVELPRCDDEYHPAELLGRGLSAYDWAGRSQIFNSETFLLLLRLCAKSGQLPTAQTLLKKMAITNLSFTAPHVTAVLATVASSDAPRPLKTVEDLVGLLPEVDSAALVALQFVFKNRQESLHLEPAAAERTRALYASLREKLTVGDEEVAGFLEESWSVAAKSTAPELLEGLAP